MINRRTTINRAINLIRMFEHGRPVTIRDVMNKLGVSKSNARRWVDELSLEYPIYEYTTPDTPVSWQNPIRYILRWN